MDSGTEEFTDGILFMINENDDGVMKRRWGFWKVLHKGTLVSTGMEYKIKLLHIDPGKSISLQYHDHRDEYWIVLQGTASAEIGPEEMGNKFATHNFTLNAYPEEDWGKPRHEMQVIPANTIHKITNTGTDALIILELQEGTETNEEDITRLEKIDGEDDRIK